MTVGELAEHNHRSYANCAIWANKNAWNDSLTTSQIALDGSETNSGCVFMDRTVESAGLWYSKNTGGNTRHNNVSPCITTSVRASVLTCGTERPKPYVAISKQIHTERRYCVVRYYQHRTYGIHCLYRDRSRTNRLYRPCKQRS